MTEQVIDVGHATDEACIILDSYLYGGDDLIDHELMCSDREINESLEKLSQAVNDVNG